MSAPLDPIIAAHYAFGQEGTRLGRPGCPTLEAVRTRVLLARYLPAPPAVVLDVGGASGAYALPLARRGYEVHLIDPWPGHVDEAARASAAVPESPLASAQLGDARQLPAADGSVDAVLLLGPLYHLVERGDRSAALAEAFRVLRPGGVLIAAAISRFASTYDGIRSGLVADPYFEGLVEGVLADGVHRNLDPVAHPQFFTLAYFHRPEELREELQAADFSAIDVVAVEGPASFQDGLDLANDGKRAAVLRAIERVEREPSLLGASSHLMGVGIR